MNKNKPINTYKIYLLINTVRAIYFQVYMYPKSTQLSARGANISLSINLKLVSSIRMGEKAEQL